MQHRTSLTYEHIDGIKLPPLVQIPDTRDLGSFEFCDVFSQSKLTRAIVRMGLAGSGLHRFAQDVGPELEGLLRHHNLRVQMLTAPLLSGTVALKDDPLVRCPFRRAAAFLLAARELQSEVMSGDFPIDTDHGEPLEMGQYPNLFGTTVAVDEAGPRIAKSHERDAVAVLCRGQCYRLCIGKAGLSELAATLEEIARLSSTASTVSPAIATCGSTFDQISFFKEVRRDPGNTAALRKLEQSMLTVCLDVELAPDDDATAASVAHSGNLHNRWYHASLQIVVFGNAKVCTVCNFAAYLDGNVVTRASADLSRRAARLATSDLERSERPSFEPLIWHFDDGALDRIRDSTAEWKNEEQSTFALAGYGAEFFRRLAVPSIPAFVVALQLAAADVTGANPRIHQFVSQSGFRCMGLRTANVTTPEVQDLAEWLSGNSRSVAETRRMVDEAVLSQRRACEAVRPYLRAEDLLFLLLTDRRGLASWRARIAIGASLLALRVSGRADLRHDIMISHPRFYPETPLIGRPGVRLPYVKYFGLHYQIHPDRTVVTITPSTDRRVSSSELVAELETSLSRLREALTNHPIGRA